MKRIAITGGGGFLGFHLRAAAQEYGIEILQISVGEKFDERSAIESIQSADAVIHLAGINRGSEEEIEAGNILFAKQLATAIRNANSSLTSIVFANSIQVGNGTSYGIAKENAGQILSECAKELGVEYRNLLLPNLYGEFGKPFYNSVVATFCYQIANGLVPEVKNDKELKLLHAQDAADYLLGLHDEASMEATCEKITVSEVKKLLLEYAGLYSRGEFPDLSTEFRRNLFNTYRSYLFPQNTPVSIVRHADQRGSFFEIVRSNGGTGQTSFSTTVSGVARGDHFHRRKVERFTVLSGEAVISLRKIFDDEVFTYRISGDQPLSVDMPTFYTHKIENIGEEMLYTAFWTNDIFNPENPDTIGELVE